MTDPGPKYHLAMWKWMLERGFHVIADSHRIAALDCQPGCRCSGCASIRRHEQRLREIRERRGPYTEGVH